jgi:signal transduction histidine kinase
VVSDPETRRRYLDSLVTQVDRLANLVDDLFELSQIEAGALALHFEPTDLGSLITEVVKVFEPDAEARGVRLTAALPAGSALLPAGRDQLGRVLANLLVNAIRHTPPGGEVLVTLCGQPGAGPVTVSVRDGCGGIPEAELPHVFDRLWRADPARSGDGVGLGLAIARGLVAAHGGTIAVRNVPEAGGCEFSVALPGPGPAPAAAEPPARARTRGSGALA